MKMKMNNPHTCHLIQLVCDDWNRKPIWKSQQHELHTQDLYRDSCFFQTLWYDQFLHTTCRVFLGQNNQQTLWSNMKKENLEEEGLSESIQGLHKLEQGWFCWCFCVTWLQTCWQPWLMMKLCFLCFCYVQKKNEKGL